MVKSGLTKTNNMANSTERIRNYGVQEVKNGFIVTVVYETVLHSAYVRDEQYIATSSKGVAEILNRLSAF